MQLILLANSDRPSGLAKTKRAKNAVSFGNSSFPSAGLLEICRPVNQVLAVAIKQCPGQAASPLRAISHLGP